MPYDARYDAAVDSAKGVWLTAVQAAHNEADHAARYAESLGSGAGPALTFDPYSAGAIVSRLRTAGRLPTTSKTLAGILDAHASAVLGVYGGVPSAARYFSPFLRRIDRDRVVEDSPSIRVLELALVSAIADANAWLALVAF